MDPDARLSAPAKGLYHRTMAKEADPMGISGAGNAGNAYSVGLEVHLDMISNRAHHDVGRLSI
jgi:hypothetical protein